MESARIDQDSHATKVLQVQRKATMFPRQVVVGFAAVAAVAVVLRQIRARLANR